MVSSEEKIVEKFLNCFFVLVYFLFGLSLFAVVISCPLPGVDVEKDVVIDNDNDNDNVSFVLNSAVGKELENGHTIIGSWSEYDSEMVVYTGRASIYDFWSTCSHEYRHSRLSMTTEKEHDIIEHTEIHGYVKPWKVKSWCLKKTFSRLGLEM